MSIDDSLSRRFTGWRRSVLAAALAAMAGGCSADVSRFDFPASVSLNDTGATGAIPVPTEPVKERSGLINSESSGGGSGQAYFPPSQRRDDGVSAAPLPDATPAPANGGYATAGEQPLPAAAAPAWAVDQRQPAASAPPPAPGPVAGLPSSGGTYAAGSHHAAASERGEMIEVRSGDTLYGLSKRHRVSLNELMTVNNLKGPNLKPGQKLYLPAGQGGSAEVAHKASGGASASAIPVDAPADWTGTYVVKKGESLYQIARQNRIKPEELQRYNGITDERRVKPGTVLRVPGHVGPQVAANTTSENDASPAVEPLSNTRGDQAPAQPNILNSSRPSSGGDAAAPGTNGKQVVAMNAPSAGSDAGKLRWPAQGKVIAGFGQRPDGTHNDGINLAVPMGTEIHAAEAGVVAYAGNELKGYGNLILLRHDNGWVTAYAHSEELLVKRGDKVKRGQIIAKAGKTGHVEQPQVHFELRQGQKPVDPTPYMERL